MQKGLIFIIILVFSLTSWSQELPRVMCKGKIIAGTSRIEDVNIINIQTEKYTSSDKDGYFSISAKVGDTVLFSGVQYNSKKHVMCPVDMENDVWYVKLEPVVNQLSEVVVVQYKNINAVALGITPVAVKSYTPAERRLKAGTRGFLSVDPLLNALSGRAGQLKRDLITEKKEFWLQKIQDLYEDALFLKEFRIPLEFVRGFQYFIVEDKHFTDLLDSNNKPLTKFVMGELAAKYKQLNCL